MTLKPGDRGIDMSGMRFTAETIAEAKAAGAAFVLRYSAGKGNTDPKAQWKLITPSEFRALIAAGFDVIANSEWYASRITEGSTAGSQDGAADLSLWRACGLAKGASIYVSLDQAPSRLKYAAVARYLAAYQKSLGGYYRVDCYGGTPLLRYLLGKGAIRYGWRPNAGSWSGDGLPYQPDTTTASKRAALVALANEKTPAHIWQSGNYWFGKSADENLIVRAPVGSHNDARTLTPKPSPTPAPVPPTTPHYPAGRPDGIVAPKRAWAYVGTDDGRIDARHNGAHVRYL